MDEIVYNGLSGYFSTLEKVGYVSYQEMVKLLVLIFFRDYVYQDYRGVITKGDYRMIEKALDCLYGTTCLIPYPDYLKMSKLHLGEMTEVVSRLKEMGNTKVVKGKNHIQNVPDLDLSKIDVIDD